MKIKGTSTDPHLYDSQFPWSSLTMKASNAAEREFLAVCVQVVRKAKAPGELARFTDRLVRELAGEKPNGGKLT